MGVKVDLFTQREAYELRESKNRKLWRMCGPKREKTAK
jgi:hypothetical protein